MQTSSFGERSPAAFTMSFDVVDEAFIFFFGPYSFVCVFFLTARRSAHGTWKKEREREKNWVEVRRAAKVRLPPAGETKIPKWSLQFWLQTNYSPGDLKEFLRSTRARRRYWARSYAGWRRFTAAQPGPAHFGLSSLEKASRINFMITQNVDRLHHSAGSNPLELHGTVYNIVCIDCGFSCCRQLFQDQLKALNPKWAAAIESLDYDSRSDKSFGMKQRPDGDIEIDEKFWEEGLQIPTCQKCNGVLKPDVVFFGDNVPKIELIKQ